MVLLAHYNACQSLSRHYHYKIRFFYTILSRTTRLDPYTALMVTVPYRRGDSNRWVRLRYGTAEGRILTVRCTAVTVYGTVNSPSLHFVDVTEGEMYQPLTLYHCISSTKYHHPIGQLAVLKQFSCLLQATVLH